ncbi:alcohol dehydrogenase [acceptor]-like [Bactrocera neohumeralis]|uniref:alcohol dehydrogenase [acceptor]-like n=1 Tax=Bactrocera neohumeralis TaxID=98809 RepID=UPI0021666FE1|nr:alcohol dehydrogenase [acceptor]-like [Bactrocera neohumeralis]
MRTTAFDFIVLGAGAAGCAAARALAAKCPDAAIALVEQGSRRHAVPMMQVPALQPFIATSGKCQPFLRHLVGQPEENLGGRALVHTRGSGLGGSTLCNDMRYLRGTAADYAAWGDDAWSWDRMLPYFTALEANTRGALRPVHGADGPLPVSDADRSSIDASLNSHIQRGTRVGVFDALIEEEQHRTPNLVVLTDTRAEQIVFEGRSAVGVLVSDGTGRRLSTRLDCGRVVLCLGALESPALLQRSGVGKAGTVLDLPAVGQNLIQGCTADIVFRALTGMEGATSRSLSARNLPYLWQQWREYQEERTGVFATLAEAGAFVRSRPTAAVPDLSSSSTARRSWAGTGGGGPCAPWTALENEKDSNAQLRRKLEESAKREAVSEELERTLRRDLEVAGGTPAAASPTRWPSTIRSGAAERADQGPAAAHRRRGGYTRVTELNKQVEELEGRAAAANAALREEKEKFSQQLLVAHNALRSSRPATSST